MAIWMKHILLKLINMENIRALFPLNFSFNKDEQFSATETRDQSDEMVDHDRQRTMISL